MSPSSSPSDADPFGFLVSCGAVASATTGRAWLQAMLDAEAALTAARPMSGSPRRMQRRRSPTPVERDRFDVDAVFDERRPRRQPGHPARVGAARRRRRTGGVPCPPRSHEPGHRRHRGDARRPALRARSSIDELGQLVDDVGSLAQQHGDAAMIGRTLMQYAVPTTFGDARRRGGGAASPTPRNGCKRSTASCSCSSAARSATWARSASTGRRSSSGWPTVSVSAPRPSRGTRSGPRWPRPRERGGWPPPPSARSLSTSCCWPRATSLRWPNAPRAPGGRRRWSTSATRSPPSAARAAAMQAPGLVATLLQCAGGHELQRAAGAWHGEWPALNALLASDRLGGPLAGRERRAAGGRRSADGGQPRQRRDEQQGART